MWIYTFTILCQKYTLSTNRESAFFHFWRNREMCLKLHFRQIALRQIATHPYKQLLLKVMRYCCWISTSEQRSIPWSYLMLNKTKCWRNWWLKKSNNYFWNLSKIKIKTVLFKSHVLFIPIPKKTCTIHCLLFSRLLYEETFTV